MLTDYIKTCGYTDEQLKDVAKKLTHEQLVNEIWFVLLRGIDRDMTNVHYSNVNVLLREVGIRYCELIEKQET